MLLPPLIRFVLISVVKHSIYLYNMYLHWAVGQRVSRFVLAFCCGLERVTKMQTEKEREKNRNHMHSLFAGNVRVQTAVYTR